MYVGRVLTAVHAQVFSWKSHAPTGLDGWAGFQNETVRKRPRLPNKHDFPSTQAALV
jgi:hypothetical protein